MWPKRRPIFSKRVEPCCPCALSVLGCRCRFFCLCLTRTHRHKLFSCLSSSHRQGCYYQATRLPSSTELTQLIHTQPNPGRLTEGRRLLPELTRTRIRTRAHNNTLRPPSAQHTTHHTLPTTLPDRQRLVLLLGVVLRRLDLDDLDI